MVFGVALLNIRISSDKEEFSEFMDGPFDKNIQHWKKYGINGW